MHNSYVIRKRLHAEAQRRGDAEFLFDRFSLYKIYYSLNKNYESKNDNISNNDSAPPRLCVMLFFIPL